jgi:hypothetical protein
VSVDGTQIHWCSPDAAKNEITQKLKA